MRSLLFPVSLFGLIYFINHLFRALASLYSNKIHQFVSLSKLTMIVFILFVICFISTFIILNISTVPIAISILYFTFVSITIGSQLIFRLLHDCRLHTFILPEMRATSSSVSTAVGRLYAGFFFVLMKICLDGVSLQTSLAICFVIFMILSFPLKKIYSGSK